MITVLSKQFEHVHAAGSSHYRYRGIAQFSGTDTTGEIPIPDIRSLKSWSFGVGVGTGAEQPWLNEAVAGGEVVVPAAGVTVNRDAGTTSGMTFSFDFEG